MPANTNAFGTVGGYSNAPATASAATSVSSGSGSSSGMSNGWYQLLQEQRDYNNRLNQENARALNEFNAAEAQKQRDWQERMSNTAHQREVQDLLAAGLNPVLSALNGNGAAVPSGAAASGSKATTDDTLSSGFISLMGAMISSSSAATVANIYTQNQRWMKENYPDSWPALLNNIFAGITDSNASGKEHGWSYKVSKQIADLFKS